MKEAGFTAVIPEGVEKGEAPIAAGDNGVGYRIEYKSEAAGLRLDYFDTKLNFSISTEVDGDGQFINYDLVSVSLLDPETADQSDVNYIAGEVSDTVMSKFCKPDPATQKVKAPKTVSKAAARSGAVYYDSNTLASRLTSSLYPEYRAQYNDNINRYGVFEDVAPWLKRWQSRYRLGMLSDAMPSILSFMDQWGILGFFDAAVISTQAGATKPDLKMYSAIAQKLDADPADCLFVDDRVDNLEGAVAAGMKAVQMARSEFLPQTIWDGPVVNSFEALDRLIEA